MSTELSALPASFSAGTTVVYRKSFSDYPASDGWAFTLYLAGVNAFDKAADADSDDFVLTLSAAETAALGGGVYKWEERVSLSGVVCAVASGSVEIFSDLDAATDGSEQSWLEPAIAALKLHIAGRLPAGMESYQIHGRAVSKIPIKEAVALLDSFETRLRSVADPQAFIRPILTRFPRTLR